MCGLTLIAHVDQLDTRGMALELGKLFEGQARTRLVEPRPRCEEGGWAIELPYNVVEPNPGEPDFGF
jgi:hypothetical protein